MKNKSFINFSQLKSVSSVTESKETCRTPVRSPLPQDGSVRNLWNNTH